MYSRTPRPRFLYRGLINGFGGSAGDRFGTESPIKLCVVATAFGRELIHGLRAVGYQGSYVCLSNSHSHSRSLSLSLARSLSLYRFLCACMCIYVYTHMLHQSASTYVFIQHRRLHRKPDLDLELPFSKARRLARPLVPGIGTPG